MWERKSNAALTRNESFEMAQLEMLVSIVFECILVWAEINSPEAQCLILGPICVQTKL